ncbi:MAG: HAD family hydrolase [Candidatus Pelagibacter sp.]|nr:HAD family hydrolase [Candidatus Pelagibacter sp.]OUV98364.1 MAG: HAD family hydrolase [Candidatus Pelagibacter sp. TMED142]|tara:strand:+ start:199 stop:879 length:681 start_codon:yes stop_codon:yes gene_type:complete
MENCIIFDLDGTLVDTAPDLMKAHNYVMRKYGYPEQPQKSIRFLAGRGAKQMIINSVITHDKIQNISNSKMINDMTKDFINFYKNNISAKSQLNKNVIDLLRWCRKKNIHLAVCTNKPEYLAVKLLRELNIDSYFVFVAGSDTFEFKKPDPRHLTNILDILEIKKNNSIMVGDSETDSEAAFQAKIKFILVANGYTLKDEENIKHDFLINDFNLIKEISLELLNIK